MFANFYRKGAFCTITLHHSSDTGATSPIAVYAVGPRLLRLFLDLSTPLSNWADMALCADSQLQPYGDGAVYGQFLAQRGICEVQPAVVVADWTKLVREVLGAGCDEIMGTNIADYVGMRPTMIQPGTDDTAAPQRMVRHYNVNIVAHIELPTSEPRSAADAVADAIVETIRGTVMPVYSGCWRGISLGEVDMTGAPTIAQPFTHIDLAAECAAIERAKNDPLYELLDGAPDDLAQTPYEPLDLADVPTADEMTDSETAALFLPRGPVYVDSSAERFVKGLVDAATNVAVMVLMIVLCWAGIEGALTLRQLRSPAAPAPMSFQWDNPGADTDNPFAP